MENLSDSHIRTKLNHAFFAAMGYYPDIIQPVQKSGSHRLYFRLKKDEVSLIGTYSPDIDETKAFIRLSEHFSERLLPVPKVIYSEPGSDVYLQTDLGEVTLHDYLEKSQVAENKRFDLYKKALSDLVKIQIEGAKQLDFSVCFPRASFDDVSMMWDLDYFKYVFLKPGNIDFHEDRLLKDFTLLVQRACEAEMKYFLYRDFQSRNIMVGNDEGLYYIDYQGGRRGALQYDVASFIFSARMPLNLTEKNELLRHYINELNKTSADVVSFEKYFPYYLLLRLFQALGAYGYRGWFEKKESFINMLPLAAKNLNELQPWFGFLSEMPEISKVVQQIIRNFSIQQIPEKLASDKLIVRIFSFSYKNRIPEDISGNGGGFIFDCRALPNPGKYEQYKANSGLDQDVKDFLAAELAVNSYIDKVFAIVSQSVEKYIARDFSNLMVSFGCTGGQHRSVYCAEKLATYLKQKYKITIEVEHMEKNVWGKGSAS